MCSRPGSANGLGLDSVRPQGQLWAFDPLGGSKLKPAFSAIMQQ